MKNTRHLIPASRRDELIVQEVENETLVYDLKSHKAHCLNPTAATVWKLCDGRRTAPQIAQKLAEKFGAPVSQDVVLLAVEQLQNLKLLEATVERAPVSAGISRRELARRLGMATALVALPLITSINAPAAIQAVSGCVGAGAACGDPNPPCCPGFNCDGICFPD
jgi:pyrroloquinoline quinone biosynthesis protein D